MNKILHIQGDQIWRAIHKLPIKLVKFVKFYNDISYRSKVTETKEFTFYKSSQKQLNNKCVKFYNNISYRSKVTELFASVECLSKFASKAKYREVRLYM